VLVGNAQQPGCLRTLPGFIVTAYYSSPTLDCNSNPVTLSNTDLPADASTVSFATEIHGQESVCLQLPNPVGVTWVQTSSCNASQAPPTITSLCFQVSTLKYLDTTPIVPVNGILVKALWNYYLVKGDGSLGIHNPTFVNQILTNTQAQLSSATCDAT
jgi:hypothetical protein